MVFDLETTELIETDVAIEDMTASVACAMWLPAANTVEASVAGADTRTFWHGSVTRAPNGEAAAGMRRRLPIERRMHLQATPELHCEPGGQQQGAHDERPAAHAVTGDTCTTRATCGA